MNLTPSRQARLTAGRTLAQAARRAGVTQRFLTRCEGAQTFSVQLSYCLARFYGCDLYAFTPTPGRPVAGRSVRSKRAGRESARPAGDAT